MIDFLDWVEGHCGHYGELCALAIAVMLLFSVAAATALVVFLTKGYVLLLFPLWVAYLWVKYMRSGERD